MAIKVRNLNGTSDSTCKCDGGWFGHWKKHGQSSSRLCAHILCQKLAEVGAHVQREGSNNWFIIPLCHEHNLLYNTPFDVAADTVFVSANVSETCGIERRIPSSLKELLNPETYK